MQLLNLILSDELKVIVLAGFLFRYPFCYKISKHVQFVWLTIQSLYFNFTILIMAKLQNSAMYIYQLKLSRRMQ